MSQNVPAFGPPRIAYLPGYWRQDPADAAGRLIHR